MAQGVDIKKRRLAGYLAGFIAGVSYGTNPLFAKPLLGSGVPVLVMLFFRYGISAAILAVWMLAKRERFRVKGNEMALLALLGTLFACSSLFLFFSYEFIPSGLATTLAVSSRYIGPTKTSILGVFEPLTAILIGTLLFEEPLTLKMGIGVALCVGAVLFMILRPHSSGDR